VSSERLLNLFSKKSSCSPLAAKSPEDVLEPGIKQSLSVWYARTYILLSDLRGCLVSKNEGSPRGLQDVGCPQDREPLNAKRPCENTYRSREGIDG
jgi:hypothetical protein